MLTCLLVEPVCGIRSSTPGSVSNVMTLKEMLRTKMVKRVETKMYFFGAGRWSRRRARAGDEVLASPLAAGSGEKTQSAGFSPKLAFWYCRRVVMVGRESVCVSKSRQGFSQIPIWMVRTEKLFPCLCCPKCKVSAAAQAVLWTNLSITLQYFWSDVTRCHHAFHS
jgi:hypothetical protein